jgi:hypothetical protein
MAGRYDPSERFKGVDPSKFASRAMTPQEKKKDEQADWMRFLGDVAPAAGTAIGGLGGAGLGALAGGLAGLPLGPGGALIGGGAGALMGGMMGAGPGSQIGGSLGGAASAALGSGADQMTSGYEDEEANKKQQRDAMLMTLMGLRR